jgi:hypothetical protein
MASRPAPSRRSDRRTLQPRLRSPITFARRGNGLPATLLLLAIGFALAAACLVPSLVRAQSASPHISSITPNTGKSEDTITIAGDNLGKDKVAAVFLSDAKLDHKAVVVDQEATKIVIKVPDGLKAGDYNISVQEGGAIYIQPVIFVVKT